MTRQLIPSAVLASLALTACGSFSVSESAPLETAPQAAIDAADEVAATTIPAVATNEVAPPTAAAAPTTTEPASTTTEPVPTTTEAPARGPMNINTDGPTVCIDAALAALGPDAMVNEIRTAFETGDDIDPPLIEDDDPPVPGDLFLCQAYYQDPANPIKLLSIRMDIDTGEFGEPEPVEISVTGDPSDFDLNDYIIKASEVNTSVVQPIMDEKAPALDEEYSIWRWGGVTLSAPGPFNDVHVFDLRLDGRLAKNDITDNGYITFTMDGTVINDFLID